MVSNGGEAHGTQALSFPVRVTRECQSAHAGREMKEEAVGWVKYRVAGMGQFKKLNKDFGRI